jgi:hypothetical protein
MMTMLKLSRFVLGCQTVAFLPIVVLTVKTNERKQQHLAVTIITSFSKALFGMVKTAGPFLKPSCLN